MKSGGLSSLRKYREIDGKVFLVGVGAAKCGTSWLYRYLKSLPEVTVSPLKEVHFFDQKFTTHDTEPSNPMAIRRVDDYFEFDVDLAMTLRKHPHFQASIDRLKMIYDDNAYFDHFARICTNRTRVLGDITPAYAVLGQSGFRYMRDFFASQDASLKIVFIMRDPVDRLWSQLRHMQQKNPSLDTARNWPDMIREPTVIERADYKQTIEAMDQVFPAQDVLYLFYEGLFSELSLRKLCRFAGAEFKQADSDKRQNETSIKIDMPGAARDQFHRILEPQYKFCRHRFGNAVPISWKA